LLERATFIYFFIAAIPSAIVSVERATHMNIIPSSRPETSSALDEGEE
jgi:hypothetical protein